MYLKNCFSGIIVAEADHENDTRGIEKKITIGGTRGTKVIYCSYLIFYATFLILMLLFLLNQEIVT